jgi:hypothetical protein
MVVSKIYEIIANLINKIISKIHKNTVEFYILFYFFI